MRVLFAALKGVVLGEATVAFFMGVLLVFAANAERAVDLQGVSPVMDTLALWPMLALVGAVAGALVGAVAGEVRERRRLVILLVGLSAYVGVCISMLLVRALPNNVHDLMGLLLLGLWVAFAYGIFALPLVVGACFAIERWTR